MEADSRWVILELNDVAEPVEYEAIDRALFTLVGDRDNYFIPIKKEKIGSYTSTSVLIEGYVFVKDNPDTRNALLNLEDHKIFSRILEISGKTQTVSSMEVGIMRRRLKMYGRKKLKLGSSVRILDGIFSNLVGEVMGLEDRGKKVIVRIKRPSREMIAPLPVTSVMEMA